MIRASRCGSKLYPTASGLPWIAASLIGGALFIDLAANRWGAYLISPLPGLFMPEFLIAASVPLTIAWLWRNQLRPNRAWFGLILVPALPLTWMLLRMLLMPTATSSFSLVIRDIAPFLYLALIPVLALPLLIVPAHRALLVVRISTAALAAGVACVQLGWIVPIPSSLTASPFVSLFQYRPDLTSAGLALAIVAWGPWLGRASLRIAAVQFVIAGIAAVSVDSRIGLLCLAFSLLVQPFQYRALLPSITVIAVSVLLFAGVFGFRAATSQSTQLKTQPDSVSQALVDTSEGTHANSDSSSQLAFSRDLLAAGPVRARIDTWILVVDRMTSRGTLWLGGDLGTNYLYQLCTGKNAVPTTIDSGDAKCPVDDAGPDPVVRDPHNWFLNLTLSSGVLGAILWFTFVLVVCVRTRGCDLWGLALSIVGLFLLLGTTSVISGGYALLPMSVALAWLVSRSTAVQLLSTAPTCGEKHLLME